MLSGIKKLSLWQRLLRFWNHTSDYYVWEHKAHGFYTAMDGQIQLARADRGMWYMVVNLPEHRNRFVAGATRKAAFKYADNWAFHRMDFFLDHFHV